ncbi:hypothetical protein FV217_20375 [Methylobacterium sp. WL9]|nr:hypothetical protein FV217_20375 [Methylobacterium sp. WL9]
MTSSDDGGGDRLARALVPYLIPDPAAAGGVLLAVSGGPDSTALLHAAAAAGGGIALAVATVDHGLRPEAAGEYKAVARPAPHCICKMRKIQAPMKTRIGSQLTRCGSFGA